MNEHQKYRILCALAAAGDISNDDLQDLRDHLVDCNDCRTLASDLIQVSALALPLHGALPGKSIPWGMHTRFVERARREGVPLSRPRTWLPQLLGILRPQWPWAVATLVALVVLVAVLKVDRLRSPSAQLNYERRAPAVATDAAAPAISSSNQVLVSRLQEDLTEERERGHRREKEIAYLKHERIDLQRQNEDLSTRLAPLEGEIANLQRVLEQRASDLAEVNKRLENKRLSEADYVAGLAERQAHVDSLRAKLSSDEAELKRSRELLAVSNQARDLIVARNLHIVDVHDSYSSGAHERPFGRIFYTEGKSLVFYAYDLQHSGNLDARVSFHVWGTRLGEQQQAMSLGVFHVEDAGAGRWVLTCDDPRALTKINTVFVTAESAKKDIDQPNGKRILYGFLDGAPNHP